mmetsp:Transcript_45375/g.102699  ORF Transcript_45375/g.102699 Transcript_45375/m.102699 type:complete len:290 (+) Transcript_45375:54-923(+)
MAHRGHTARTVSYPDIMSAQFSGDGGVVHMGNAPSELAPLADRAEVIFTLLLCAAIVSFGLAVLVLAQRRAAHPDEEKPLQMPEDREMGVVGGNFDPGHFKLYCEVGQVTIRWPLPPGYRGPLFAIAVVYGFLPFVVPAGFFVWALVSHEFFPLFGFLIAVCLALVNECAIKPICAAFLPRSFTARPRQAASKKPGMPSGHCLNAYSIGAWCALECALEPGPLHGGWLLCILAVCIPVPWARVYNRDHTVAQVSISCGLGLIVGIAAFTIRHAYFSGKEMPWDAPGVRY